MDAISYSSKESPKAPKRSAEKRWFCQINSQRIGCLKGAAQDHVWGMHSSDSVAFPRRYTSTRAVEIRKTYEHSDRDADFASQNANLGRAYAALGSLPESDTYYSIAVTIFKAANANLPTMKEDYSARLKNTLLEYAKLKAALGQNHEASLLEAEAAHL